MKTTTTIKQTLMALTLALGIVSCKKDKKTDPTPPLVEVKAISITDLKALSTGASVKIPDGRTISGIVISDASSKNIDGKTVILQDASNQTGIIVTFDAAQTFVLGDQVQVAISNQTLAQVNGEVEVTNVPAANAKKTGTGTITAKPTTIADINTNKTNWDGTLVTIAATELSGGNGKYTGSLTIKDASGASTTNILAGAAFENTVYPASVSAITGIVRLSGTSAHIDIRKTTDVTQGAISKVVTDNWIGVQATGSDTYIISNGTADNPYHGFTGSAISGWNAASQEVYLFPPSSYETAFNGLDASKNYVYIAPDYRGAAYGGGNQIASTLNHGELKGLKTVTVTFGGSTATHMPYNGNITTGDHPVKDGKPFDAVADYYQIGIKPTDVFMAGSDIDYFGQLNPGTNEHTPMYVTLKMTSAKVTKQGEFNTFTYTLPTKDQLIASGLSSSDADAWLNNPNIVITNESNLHDDSWGNAPIIIKQVVFSY